MVIGFQGFQSSEDREGTSIKRFQFRIRFASHEVEVRFKTLDLGTRKIFFGRPLLGNSYTKCVVFSLFTKLGVESFIRELPKVCI